MNTKTQQFEDKYSHVVKGSTRLATTEEVANYTWASHKFVCTIKCECGATRNIAKQDAWQVKQCETCQRTALNKRRSDRHKEMKAKEKANGQEGNQDLRRTVG